MDGTSKIRSLMSEENVEIVDGKTNKPAAKPQKRDCFTRTQHPRRAGWITKRTKRRKPPARTLLVVDPQSRRTRWSCSRWGRQCPGTSGAETKTKEKLISSTAAKEANHRKLDGKDKARMHEAVARYL